MSAKRSVLRLIRFALPVVIATLALSALAGTASAEDAAPEGRLSANRFVSLEPFIIPMMPEGSEPRQFTLVFALELKDEGDREFVKSRVTLLRDKIYDLLFRLIAYRTQKPLVPNTGLIKQKIFGIARSVMGKNKISSIVVQQVYQGRAP